MKRIIKFLAAKKWGKSMAKKVIATSVINSKSPLTPDYLQTLGFVQVNDGWTDISMKHRNRIVVRFEAHYYRVYWGKDEAFLALESSKEWFDMFYMITIERCHEYAY